jgi:geranylgeranyl pyrophosphate synthase
LEKISKNRFEIAQEDFVSNVVSDSEICIKDVLDQCDNNLKKVLWEFISEGKRLRPYILASIARMLNGDKAMAIRLAASVEIYHNATLIFDDIQDNSMMRRGKATLNARFGTGVAISFASVLRSMMMRPFADLPILNNSILVYKWINKVAIMLSLGQYREMMWSYLKNLDVSEKDYLEMTGHKTGALIGLSAFFGGMTASNNSYEKLYEFGYNLGIAYQILDDIGNVDTASTQDKDKFSDIYERKVTLLVVHSLTCKQEKWRNDLITIFSKNEITEADVRYVLDIFQDTRALQYCHEVADYYVQNAINLLLEVPASDSVFRDRFITEIKEIFNHA